MTRSQAGRSQSSTTAIPIGIGSRLALPRDYISEANRHHVLHPLVWVPLILAGVVWLLAWAVGFWLPGPCGATAVLWAGGILLLLGLGAGLATNPQVAIVGGGLGGVIALTGFILVSTGHC